MIGTRRCRHFPTHCGSDRSAEENDPRMIAKIVHKIGNTPYVRKAVADKADLGAFRQRPTARILFGVFLIGFSYLIGWPAVGALGVLAVYLEQPLVALIGGPLTYGLSHLVFLAGMVLAGAEYSAIFLRWATRMVMEKLMKKYARPCGGMPPQGVNDGDAS
jgi:hypothetical protein